MTTELMRNLDDLVVRRYVNLRVNPEGLRIYKYNKNVFFKDVWKQNPLLLEARGIVLDKEGNIVSYPFSKVFNDGEWNHTFDRGDLVYASTKIDGFMAVVTWHNGNLLVTSSGTFDSDYVRYAKEWLQGERVRKMCEHHPSTTFIFEIVDSRTSKVIDEHLGAYLVGAREKVLGSELYSEQNLDDIFVGYMKHTFQFFRPSWKQVPFASIVDACDHVDGEHIEGYVCYNNIGECVKIKTQYYLVQKFLSRTNRNMDVIWTDQAKAMKSLPYHFERIIKELPEWHSAEEWRALDENGKLATLRDILSEV
jgi:hypothetical protein